ncbi:MAG: SDR family oxidoreductase [Pseudomonadota bacterium]
MQITPSGAALVTGAGKRVGREIALFLGRCGFDVAVHYAASQEEAEGVVAELRAMGRRAVSVRADLLDEAQVREIIPQAVNGLDRPLSVLVNNASIFEHETYQTASRDSWDRHIESNLRAPMVLLQDFATQVPEPVADDHGEPLAQGLVINMIDQRVRKMTPDFPSYTIAKAGLWTLTQTAAQFYAPRLRVNGIGPGPTLRSIHQSEEQFCNQRAHTVLQRGSNVSDIVGAVGYFLQAPAVTGQLLCVDGGQHLAWKTPDVLGVDV